MKADTASCVPTARKYSPTISPLERIECATSLLFEKFCVERRGRESSPQEPLDPVIYKRVCLMPNLSIQELVRRVGLKPTTLRVKV